MASLIERKPLLTSVELDTGKLVQHQPGLAALSIIIGLILSGCTTQVCFASEVHTNLEAIIYTKVVTNVVAGDNHKGCQTCKAIKDNPFAAVNWNHPWHADGYMEWTDATEKWEIFNVVSQETVMFIWNGKHYGSVEERLISSTTNRWKLQNEWVKVK